MLTVLTNVRSTKVLLYVEDDLVQRQPLVEDDLWWKTTLSGKLPLVEDDLQ